jgi:purine-nucleoside phosphorylase
MYERIEKATSYIVKRIPRYPDIAVILGSGLGGLANLVTEKVEIDYKDIPEFPKTTVVGHAGKLIFGYIGRRYVVMMQGRFHYYEGHDMDVCTLPVRVFASMGIKNLLVTNAAGGIGDHLNPGDIMLIKDHISLFMPSVLRGPNLQEFGPRFPDMTHVYSLNLINKAKKVALDNEYDVKEGVYSYFTGPRYETPADIKALKVLGADATGMSTVPEAIVAKHSGMSVLGISLITNKAAGLGGTSLSHSEVLETVKVAGERITNYVKELIVNIF